MIQSEKDLEDYICNNQDEFISKLKDVFYSKDIEFIGRQVRIGNDNIADLVYLSRPDEQYPITELIIVELKFRELQCKDLSQIARYICVMQEKDEFQNFENIYGCFVSFGCSSEMKDVSKLYENIKFLNIKSNIKFNEEHYVYTKEYLDNLSLDDRLKEYMNLGETE